MQDKKFEIIISVCLMLIFFYIYQLSEKKPTQQNIAISEPTSLICFITAYTNSIKETNSDNQNTATMEKPIAGWSCAVSRDLIHWLGGRIYIKGIGVRYVNDLMNKRFEKSIDLFMGEVKQAKEFGRQKHKVIFLGR